MGPGNQTQILRVGSKYRATFGPWRDSFRQEPRFFLGVDLFQPECPLTKFREHSRPHPGCFARRRVLSSYLGNINDLWNRRSRNPKHLRSNDLPALPQHPVASQNLFRSRPLRAVATGYGVPTLPTSALTHPSRDFGGAAMARP